MIAYYLKFCPNLSSILAPLTGLVSPKVTFVWDSSCQEALEKVKRILMSSPVLVPPNYDREFRLCVDSCDDEAGASLVQEGEDNIEHPISYYSNKYNKYQRNYAVVEKEAMALLL